MIDPAVFVNKLCDNGVGLFTGVPDSLLKNLCSYLDSGGKIIPHITAANEGNAAAIAAGYHLATGKFSAVYMQNSGLGNTVNPLASLLDKEVYRIPAVLIVGWRGEPEIKDEPQHVKQGKITIGQLELMDIPYWVLDKDSDVDAVLKSMFENLKVNNSPVAIVVKKGTFSENTGKPDSDDFLSTMLREEALSVIIENSPDAIMISTTGKTSRELFELRKNRNEDQRDFLTVGSMGHTSSIALGAAIGNKNKRIICLDGDGSLIMHMGAMPIIGNTSPKNFIHILLNNSSHESVGGQPTVARHIDFEKLSIACGYTKYYRAGDMESLKNICIELQEKDGPLFVEVLLRPGSRDNLGRPTSTPEKNKQLFMEAFNE